MRTVTHTTITLLLLASTGASQAADRPNLSNFSVASPFGANGHSSSIDGRLFMGNIGEDQTNYVTTWTVRVFRPEALSYDSQGKPQLGSAFSSGKTVKVQNGENALAFCFPNPAQPYTVTSTGIRYTPWLMDSQMYNRADGSNASTYGVFRRRPVQVDVSSPFTASAEVSSVSLGGLEPLTTTTGKAIKGIEPTMTSDGRLLVYQGGPANDGTIDHLMYSYNTSPCSAAGWSDPKPLSSMNSDPNPDLKARYALARGPLKAATGEAFATSGTTNLLHGAYPWVDHEGRNVVYMGVVYTDGARREGVTLVGADTGYTSTLIDSAINSDRLDRAQLFYSGPMWNFEQERAPEQTYPVGADNTSRYLPVTKSHDVLALFGSNTADYSEVDVAELYNPFTLLYLPMNELVKRDGSYDLTRTPDLGGKFYTASLKNGASIPASMSITLPADLNPRTAHAKGKALVLNGQGQAAQVSFPLATGVTGVSSDARGFTVQLLVRPDTDINAGCSGTTSRALLSKTPGARSRNKQGLELWYESDSTLTLALYIGGNRVSLGKSPAIPKGAWTHVAYTFDGTTGTFGEYLNGLRTGRALPTVAAGSGFALGTGTLTIGATGNLSSTACPAADGAFKGAIDEVRLFTHARSNRSVCLSTFGSDCRDEAIQEDPSAGQLVLASQWPTCESASALGTTACAAALHRLCAQRGAMDALDSTTNLANTVSQLISNRPPISLSGVPVRATSSALTVACAPLENDSLALTFEELARFHSGCSSDSAAMSGECSAATHRFCASLGWTSGHIMELTTRPWVSCFDADWEGDVSVSALGTGCSSSPTSGDCRMGISQWCQGRGYGGGILQEIPASGVLNIACFQAAAQAEWKFK